MMLLCGLSLIGCGGGAVSSETFGLASPARGSITMANGVPDQPISGVIFSNQGTSDVTIDQIRFVLSSGEAIDGGAGVGVTAGNSVTYLYDNQSAHPVDSLSFAVHGSTETLVVLQTQETGIVPAQCRPGTAGQPSAEGGCCSEWIPCTAGLACNALPPVYPGSLGVCARPAGCEIAASSYDQSCRQDADCVPVYQGELCNAECTCPNAAINSGDVARYQADYSASVNNPNVCDCALLPRPRCVASVCTL
jgi:hypothetical protein